MPAASAPATSRRGHSPVRASDVRSLKSFLATPAARRCDQVWVIRTSSASKRDFEAMFRAGVALAPKDPDVQVLAGVGHKIVMPEGATDRQRLGAMELRRGSVQGASGTKLLGWCIPIGHTLFILYLDSARKADLAGPTPDQSRNAFSEALCEVIREVQPKRLYAPLLSRLVRHFDFGMAVLRTLREFGVEVWVEGKKLEFTGEAGELRGILETYFSARDADGTVGRLQGVEADIRADGGFYGALEFLPFTWRPKMVQRIDPLTGEPSMHVPDKRDLEVTPNSVPVFDNFMVMLSQRHRTLQDIAEALGKLGVRTRNPGNFHDPKLLSADNAGAVATLIQPRWLDAWLTGNYRTTVKLRADIRDTRPDLEDLVSTRETKNGEEELYLDVTVPLPMPERGYWLTEAQWQRIMDVRHAPTPQRIGRAASTGDRRPLASLAQWDDPDTGKQHRLATFDSSDAYSCIWRPLSEAYDAGGSPLGWKPEHKANKLASVSAPALHQSIGAQLIALAADLEDQVAPLTLPTAQAAATNAPLLRAEAALEAAREAVAKVEARIKGIRRERQEARGRGDDDEVAALDEDAADAKNDLAQAKADVEKAEQALKAAEKTAPAAPTTVTADLGSLELVGVALMRCGPKAPAALNDALALLLRDSLRVIPASTGLTVTWTATVTVPLVDGGEGTHEISSPEPVPGIAFTVRRLDRRGKATDEKASPDWDDRLAQAYFDEGQSLAEVAAARGVDGSGKNDTYPVRRLRAWLADHGVVNSKRRLAAMDAPSEVRQVLARLLRGNSPATAYEKVLLETYTRDEAWGSCWAADTHDHARALHAAVEALGGKNVDPLKACQKAGLTWPEMVLVTGDRRLYRVGGKDVDAGPVLHRNWTSLGQGDDPKKVTKTLSLLTCPHADCLAKRTTGKPGVLIQLLVPELANPSTDDHVAGLLCRSCRRTPDNTQAVFPEVYLKPWRGGRRSKVVDDGQEQWVGSHLPAPVAKGGGRRRAKAA